jgi:RNA polymerase sigma factor (sigma-70 family)
MTAPEFQLESVTIGKFPYPRLSFSGGAVMNQGEDSEVAAAVDPRKQFDEKAPEYRNTVFAIIFSITHDRELSDEIVQQTFVKYLDRMDKTNWEFEIANVGAYLVQIAKNLLRDVWKDQDRWEFTSLEDQLDDQLLNELSQLTDTFDVQKKIHFEELFRILPFKTLFGNFKDEVKARIKELYFDEDFTVEEIAEQLNIDVIVVNVKLNALCATLRARLKTICGKTGLFKSDS